MQGHAGKEHGAQVEGEGHDAKSADLDEAEDDDLTGGSEECGCIFDGETCNTDGAGASEEGIQPRQGLAGFDRARELQEQSADADDEGKTAHEEPARTDVEAGDLGLMSEGTEAE